MSIEQNEIVDYFTADDVLEKVDNRSVSRYAPIDAADIFAHFIPKGVYVASATLREVFRHVSRKKANEVLAELVNDGRLVRHTGKEWKTLHGVKGYGQYSKTTYYATRADIARWNAERAAEQDRERLTLAHEMALEELLTQYASEYAALVASYKATLDNADRNDDQDGLDAQ